MSADGVVGLIALIVILPIAAYVRNRAYGPTRPGERVILDGAVVRFGEDPAVDAEIRRRER